jgi:hypothetical protein
MEIETLRPNAPGDETSIEMQEPASGAHWEKVDEAESDEYNTYIGESRAGYHRDLYNLPASSGSGTINFIKVYFVVVNGGKSGNAKPSLKSNSTVTDGTEISVPFSWEEFSQQWNANPADGQPWEWADIDALKIGVSLESDYPGWYIYCTQVYVEVHYTPPPPAFKGSRGYIIG